MCCCFIMQMHQTWYVCVPKIFLIRLLNSSMSCYVVNPSTLSQMISRIVCLQLLKTVIIVSDEVQTIIEWHVHLSSVNIRLLSLQQARPLLDERNLDKLVDPQLGHMYNVCQMQAMISAAALCVRQSLQHRPQISQVNLFHRASLSIMRNLDLMHLIPSLLSKSTSCKKVIHQSFCIR